jgi:release factor glutamine methyltransferase
MTIIAQYELLCQQLQKLYAKAEAETIASWVIEHYTGLKRVAVKLDRNKPLTRDQRQQVEHAANELMHHKPVQYVLKEAWFKNMVFYVDEHVLIPRPETEELVDWVIEICKHPKINTPILEIGTGSGCISITLKKALPEASITAIDISEAALKVAEQNAKKLHASVNFAQLDFLSEALWQSLSTYKIIVSNPPYIPLNEKEKLDKNVTAWEPDSALFVPDNDPLIFYRKMAAFGKTNLEKDGMILVECHQDYAKDVQRLFEENGYETNLKKDMFDNERMVKASIS